MDDVRNGLDVGDLEGRVRRGFNPHHLGVGLQGLADLLGVGGVHEGGLDVHAGGHFPAE